MFTHPILQALEIYEGREGTPPREEIFFKRGPWFASPRLKLSFNNGIPGLGLSDMAGLLFKPDGHAKLSSRAEALQAKEDMTRLRAFYLPQKNAPGRCIKIVAGGDHEGIAQRTRDEIALRRKLETLTTITLPRLQDIREEKGFIHISEEMITGRRFAPRQDIRLFIATGLPQLIATYQTLGVRWEPLSAHYAPALIDQLVANPKATAALRQAVAAAFAADPLVAVGLCHGDLLPSNLCVSRDRLYFFDWEKSRQGPLLADLMRLPMKYPRQSAPLAAAMLRSLRDDIGQPAPALAHHFAVDTARRLAGLPQRATQIVKLWEKTRPHGNA